MREDIHFTDGAETKTWDEAVAARWIADVLWGAYNVSQDRYLAIDELDPWQGYWLYTYVPGLTMVLKFGAASLGGAGLSPSSSIVVQSGAPTPPPPPMQPTMDPSTLQVVNEPNPVRDVHTTTFRVVGPMASLVEAIRVRIYDLEGRLVYEAEVPDSELTWHTENLAGEFLANGVYLYRVEVKVADQWITAQVKKLAICR